MPVTYKELSCLLKCESFHVLGIICIMGISKLQTVDLNSMRNLFILCVSLFTGIVTGCPNTKTPFAWVSDKDDSTLCTMNNTAVTTVFPLHIFDYITNDSDLCKLSLAVRRLNPMIPCSQSLHEHLLAEEFTIISDNSQNTWSELSHALR